MPYSTFLAETLGVIVAAVAASWLLRLSLSSGAAIVVFVVVCSLAVPMLWSGVSDSDHWRQLLRPPSGVSPRLRCFYEDGAVSALPVMWWLQRAMPARATYVLESSLDHGCVAFGLLPRVPAGPTEKPEWIIYWGTVPRVVLARARAERDLSPTRRTVRLFNHNTALVRAG